MSEAWKTQEWIELGEANKNIGRKLGESLFFEVLRPAFFDLFF